MRASTRRAAPALLSAAAFLYACALVDPLPSMVYLPPGHAHVDFVAEVFHDSAPRGVRHYGAQQTQEYLLFVGEGAQAELIFDTINEFGASMSEADALEFPRHRRKERAESWNFNRNRAKRWGVENHVQINTGGDPFVDPDTYSYLPYVLLEIDHDCFAFEAAWDQPAYDPDFSPSKLLFGYYCEAPGRALDEHRVGQLLKRIRIRTEGLPLELAPRPPRGEQSPDPMRIAQGSFPDSETGNQKFPFLFKVVHGQIGGDDMARH